MSEAVRLRDAIAEYLELTIGDENPCGRNHHVDLMADKIVEIVDADMNATE
jgi:hypothetical protein